MHHNKLDRIVLFSPAEIVEMRKACCAAADMLHHVGQFVRPGVSTQELNDIAVQWTAERGYTNGPLNYGGYTTHANSPIFGSFPRAICTSVNDVVCHGIPSKSCILKDGDIVNVDVSPIVNGWFGDTSRTFIVGTPSLAAKKLVDVTEECLRHGIRAVKPGGRIGDIGKAIEQYAHSQGFSVVRDFVGHGIGRIFHTTPHVPHYFQSIGPQLEKGMIFTIEPMINEGSAETKVLPDGWTAITIDSKLSAQFEHTVLVTDTGVEVLTLRQGEIYPYK